ncbi:hypothetical protein HDK64DRAFT_258507 [Phyllosticta capitalensis]
MVRMEALNIITLNASASRDYLKHLKQLINSHTTTTDTAASKVTTIVAEAQAITSIHLEELGNWRMAFIRKLVDLGAFDQTIEDEWTHVERLLPEADREVRRDPGRRMGLNIFNTGVMDDRESPGSPRDQSCSLPLPKASSPFIIAADSLSTAAARPKSLPLTGISLGLPSPTLPPNVLPSITSAADASASHAVAALPSMAKPWPEDMEKKGKKVHLEYFHDNMGLDQVERMIHPSIASKTGNRRWKLWEYPAGILMLLRHASLLVNDVEVHRAALLLRVTKRVKSPYRRSTAGKLNKGDLKEYVLSLCADQANPHDELKKLSRQVGQKIGKTGKSTQAPDLERERKRKADDTEEPAARKCHRTEQTSPAADPNDQEEEDETLDFDLGPRIAGFHFSPPRALPPPTTPDTIKQKMFKALFTGEGGWRSYINLNYSFRHNTH